MLTCRDTSRLCSDEMERHLTLREQLGLRTHLMMCSGCSNYRKQIRLLQAALQGSDSVEPRTFVSEARNLLR